MKSFPNALKSEKHNGVCYDERSGRFINRGSDYGVGHKQPLGHEGVPKQVVPALPQKAFCEEA